MRVRNPLFKRLVPLVVAALWLAALLIGLSPRGVEEAAALVPRARSPAEAAAQTSPAATSAFTLTLPLIANLATAPIAQIRYETGDGFAPLAGSLLTTTTLTLRIDLLAGVTGVAVLQAQGGEEPDDITASFPGLEAQGVATATLTLLPGDYLFSVEGSRAGDAEPDAVTAGALALPPDWVVFTSAQSFPLETGTDPNGDPFDYESQVALLSFVPGSSVAEMAAFLRGFGLYPLDWLTDLDFVRVRSGRGEAAAEMVARLGGVGGILEAASLNVMGQRRDATGEQMPAPLTAAYQAQGNADCSGPGGDWEGCFAHNAGNATSPIDRFRFHFMLETFAAHRLVTHLLPPNPARPGLAITDSGIGHTAGAANTHAGIPVADLFNFSSGPFNCDVNGIDRQPNGLPKTIAHARDTHGHGTQVAAAAAARLGTVLGTGQNVRVRPMRDNASTAQVIAAINCAARDPQVHVMNISWGTTGATAAQRAQMLRAVELFTRSFRDANGNGAWDPGEPFFDTNGNGVYDPEDARILVAAMDNEGVNRGITSIPDGFAPDTFNGPRAGADPLVVAVCATGSDLDPARGPEHIPDWAAWGERKSLSAPGADVVLPDHTGALDRRDGCSFAAPVVAGLAAEMRLLDRSLHITPADRLLPLQIVELIEATADDLGTTVAGNNLHRPNDNPGNGNDLYFGHGRVNAWKAILGLVNRGLPAESQPNLAAQFPTLRAVDEASTRWYGFKIHAPIHGATVWIDGVQVTDADSSAPGGINAYAGVRMDRTIRVGIPNEDPTSGMVPLGSNSNFLITFSMERDDLIKPGGPRVLQLRRPGQTADDPPFFNLALHLQRMRDGEIPGVVFDDFVFEVTPPDFGDAYASPTTLAENGPRHLHTQPEYFGRLDAQGSLDAVSPEHDVIDPHDVDGVPNWRGGLLDLDGKDDGITFYPLTYKQGETGRADVRVCVADPGPRYDRVDPDRQIYVNGWIDWDTNGLWDAPNEHVLDSLRLAPVISATLPAGVDWRPVTATLSGDVTLLNADRLCAEYRVEFPVPAIGNGDRLESRWRLDYGENVGRHVNGTFTSSVALSMTHGPAFYGEVEDYVIGSDFGDAGPDGPWPTSLGSNGARHLSFFREWIGPFRGGVPSASREPDACATNSSDEDGVDNIGATCDAANQDRFDDFSVIIIEPGKVLVQFEVSAAVAGYGVRGGNGGIPTLQSDCSMEPIRATPPTPLHQSERVRYDASDGAKRLYVNIFADWDGNGSFETQLLSAPMDPEDWGANGVYTFGEPFTDANHDGVWNPGETFTDTVGVSTRVVTCIFPAPVPPPPDITQWVRLRLDYGENAGQLPPRREDPFAEDPPHMPAADKGGAVWGEVEDAPLVGPAAPVKIATPTLVRPKETLRYVLAIPASPDLDGISESFVQDFLPQTVTFVEGSLSCTYDNMVCQYNPTGHSITAAGPIEPGQIHYVSFEVIIVPPIPPVDPPPCPPEIVNVAEVYDGVLLHTLESVTKVVCE